MRAIVERSTRANSCAYGRAASADSCARRNLAAATNFMARVICWLFFTERMRRRKSRSVAITVRYTPLLKTLVIEMNALPRRHRNLSREPLLERIHRFLDLGPDAVVQSFLFLDRFQK